MWFARDFRDWDAVRSVLIASIVGLAVNIVITVWATLEGWLNVNAWGSAVVLVLLLLGGAYELVTGALRAAWPSGSPRTRLLDQTRSTLTTLHRSRVARRKASATQPPSVNRQERSVLPPPASLRGKRRDMLAARPLSWVGIACRSQRRDTTGSLEGAGGATPGVSA